MLAHARARHVRPRVLRAQGLLQAHGLPVQLQVLPADPRVQRRQVVLEPGFQGVWGLKASRNTELEYFPARMALATQLCMSCTRAGRLRRVGS